MSKIPDMVKITFFMPVVERNIAIADYCVRSYAKIKDMPFVLVVYLNGVSERAKKIYADRWRKLRFVEIVDPDSSTLLPHAEVLDQELKKIQTPYFATVDYDFEILDARFVTDMVRRLEENENLAAMSTDYYNKHYRFPKSIRTLLMPCYNAWFVIYKRNALQCHISHAPYRIVAADTGELISYDLSSRFQEALIKDYGFDIGYLGREYKPCFIHYGSMAWGKRSVTRANAFLYRRLKILSRNGLWGKGRIIVRWANNLLKRFFCGGAGRKDMKHLLYVSTTLPTPGFGSSVILYRHLKRLEGWRVTILVDDDSALSRYELPEEWRIIKTGRPRWWWLPVKKFIPATLALRLGFLSAECRQIFKEEKPGAILTQFGKNSLLAAYLSKKLGIPLSVIVHDRWQVWGKLGGADRFLTDDLALSVLEQASRVWPVTEEMVRFYAIRDPKKISVLYPIPEGGGGNFTAWRPEFAARPVLAFAGSYHSPQAPTLRLAAENLKNTGGELIIVTKNMPLIKKEAGEHSNIRYVEPFSRNDELIAFLKDNASAILISGSIDTKALGWQFSFPSRLVELVHTGLPVIIAATSGTALASWANKHKWIGFVDAGDKKQLEGLMSSLKERESWEKMAEQSRAIALGEFDPERIQKQFELELVS